MAGPARFKGRIGYAGALLADNDLWFQYNPSTVQYSRSATYSKNQAAFADFPNSSASAIPSLSWIRNEAEDISIELIFHEDGKRNVEKQLQQLDDFMKPDANTGKPKPLFFSFGSGRSDRIVILQKNVTGTLYDPTGLCQEAKVSLKFTALTSRVRS
jgi:hypothetical protein